MSDIDQSAGLGLELPSQDLLDSGALLLIALLDWPTWSHRKVESLDFYEGRRGRRRVSLDCTPLDVRWVDASTRDAGVGSSAIVVPLTTMRKEMLRQLDVRDANGASLPVLGSASNGLLAAAALFHLVAYDVDRETAVNAWPRLVSVAQLDELTAQAEAERLCADLELDLLTEQWIRDLASAFILMAVLPVSAVGTRLVVKYSYHWEYGVPSPHSSLRSRVRGWATNVAAGLGFAALPIDIDLNSADSSSSYHLECAAPEGVSCGEIRLPVDDSGVHPRDSALSPVGHVKGRFNFGHGGVDEPARVSLVMNPEGALPRAALFSGLTTIFMMFLITVPGALAAFIKDPGSALSLLLFLPAILLALNAKGSENVFVSRFLRPSRIISASLSAIYAVSGGLLVAGAPPEVILGWWRFSLFFSVMSLILTAGGLHRLYVTRRV